MKTRHSSSATSTRQPRQPQQPRPPIPHPRGGHTFAATLLTSLRDRPLALFYLSTPLFAGLDFGAGWSLRAGFLNGYPGLRIFYYVACLLLGITILKATRRTAALAGLGECSLNILLLVLSVMVPVYSLPACALAGQPVGNPFTPAFFLNFVISAFVFLRVFYTNPIVRAAPRLDR